MNRRYLEIDSTYRDRNLYPNPSQFEVLITQSGSKGKFNALDPITTAVPAVVFNGSFDLLTPSDTATIINLLITGIGGQTTSTTPVIQTLLGELHQKTNFYRGAVIELINGADIVRRKIESYVFLDSDVVDSAKLVLESAIPDLFLVNPGTSGSITNSTDTTLTSEPSIFVPAGTPINEFYNTNFIQNLSLDPIETREIVNYQIENYNATIDSVAPGWLATHDYIIRETLPSSIGIINPIPAPTINSISLSNGLDRSNLYTGDFVRLSTPGITGYNEIRRIESYTGTTQQAYVYPSFSTIPVAGPIGTYEILPFTRDNVYPFNYGGSSVSQQEVVCYEIKLLNLVLPNIVQNTGGRIAFYPYVYVELNNISSAGAYNNAIYSNNPNAQRMLFRAKVDDVNNPLTTAFVKLNGDGAVQTVKFKPNDNLKFGVYLFNGNPFKVNIPDTTGPYPPNVLVQVSAIFSMKRL